jgi:RNA-directed DNA polymerase
VRFLGWFQYRTDAERFLQWFRERLAKFGLELHADKTRLIGFGRFAAGDRKQRGEGSPETFTFLRPHFWGQRKSNGAFIVWRSASYFFAVLLENSEQR